MLIVYMTELCVCVCVIYSSAHNKYTEMTFPVCMSCFFQLCFEAANETVTLVFIAVIHIFASLGICAPAGCFPVLCGLK